jgi:hypothetical protein
MPDYYNHPRWPSPRARLVVRNLDLDIVSRWPLTRLKRVTHAEALDLLRHKAKKATLEEFLAMSENDAWVALGCTYHPSWSRQPIAYNPLYGLRLW